MSECIGSQRKQTCTATGFFKTSSGRQGFFSFAKYPLILICLLTLAGTAFAVTDMNNVEMDGNIADGAILGGTDIPTDWGDLFNTTGVPNPLFPPFTATAWNDDQPTPDTTYFGLGKDIDLISGWTCVSQPNPLDKADILHAYAALSVPTSGPHAGHRVLNIGLERYSNNGTASLGFWLLKDGTVGCSAPGTFTGAHQDGDILIASEFTNGGSVSTISAFRWEGSPGALNPTPIANGADCQINPQVNPNLCATVNAISIPTPWFTHPKTGADNNLPPDQFFEAAVDLDAILPEENKCFTGILGTTRSSAGITADIKDFTRINLNTCGTLTIIKDAVPNGQQDFSFTTTGTGLAPFSLDDDSDPTLSNTQVFTGLAAGTYSVAETPATGWTQTSAICSDGSPANAISIQAGESITCTFTNTLQTATLIVIKHVINDNGGTASASDFTMAVTGDSPSPASFSGAESPGTTVTLNAGSYNATESAVTGYSASYSADCTGSIAPGATKTCTITNDDIAPTITLNKTVNNNYGGTAVSSNFTLKIDGGAVTQGAANPVAANAAHTINETMVNGYEFVSIAGNAKCPVVLGGSATLLPGENITCTITNRDIQPKLTVIKHVINNNGGTKVAANFSISITGTNANPANFAGNEAGTNVTLNAGSYSVSETGLTGYAASYSADCSGSISVGEEKICTITNSDIAPKLTLTKTVVNDNGGNAIVSNFPLFVNGNPVTSGVANTLSANILYTASETNLTGYTASAWGGDCATNGTITLQPGDNKTCTITNDDIAPKLTLIKIVINDNRGNALPNDFSLTIGGNAATSGTPYTLTANSPYAINETQLTGYTFISITGNAKCPATLGGTITLDEGDDITCTITNNDIAPKLTIIKTVINDDGGNAIVSDFPLFINGGLVTSGVATVLSANTPYITTEINLTGYTASAWGGDCTADGTITLNEGDNKTCTITNNDIAPTLKLVKTVTNDNGGTATANDFQAYIDQNPEAWNTQITLTAGPHTASEDTLQGYTASNWTGDCASNGTVTLALAENKTCYITNNDIAPQLTIIKHVINDNEGTATANQWTMDVTATNPSNNHFAGTESPGTTITLDAGAYSVDESGGASGYAKTIGTDCSGTIAIGETKTCTITNNDIQPKLTVTKIVVNDNGGTLQVSNFPLFVSQTQVASGAQNGFNAGNYLVSETTQFGYAASAWSGDCDAQGNITLNIGDEKACTITNDDIQPTLTLEKTVVNDNGGTATETNFQAYINGNTTNWNTPAVLNAGNYLASEDQAFGYTASAWGGDCAADGTVTLSVGENKTCYITNDDIAPKLTIIKTVINDNGGNATIADFPLFINGGLVTSGVANTLMANTLYTATETQQTGYAASIWGGDCAADGTITLQPGDNKTCTITNNDISLATRTQGFWQTHTAFTSSVFASFFGSGMTVGTGSHTRLITNLDGKGNSILFGAYYSSIPYKTTGVKRTDLDKARMQLLQQLVTAKLNCAAFGCYAGTTAMINAADAAYAGSSKSAILSSAALLDAYNNSGDPIAIPASLGPQGSATPGNSQARANKSFWNAP